MSHKIYVAVNFHFQFRKIAWKKKEIKRDKEVEKDRECET